MKITNSMMPVLLPGDHLLYGSKDLFGTITEYKTWSNAVHIEIYAGNMQAVASRNGVGVDLYPYRTEQLVAVLRPNRPFNFEDGMEWFRTKAKGQKYDWKGLLCFSLAVKQGSPNKMFCSEFATRFGRATMLNPISLDFDADKVAPGSFFMSPTLSLIWGSNE